MNATANLPILQSFRISALHGKKDIELLFEANKLILVSKNGQGKTTILSILNAVLAREMYRLKRYQFEELSITFEGYEPLTISYQEIMSSHSSREARFQARIARLEDHQLFEPLLRLASTSDYHDFGKTTEARYFSTLTKLNVKTLYETLRSFVEPTEKPRSPHHLSARDFVAKLQDIFPISVIFYPTYRRIEETLESLGVTLDDQQGEFENLRFGMSDVEERWQLITNEIKTSSVKWFSKLNGQMLSHLVNDSKSSDDDRNRLQQDGSLTIVLERIGSSIDTDTKKKIRDLIASKAITQPQYDPLVYFLTNLMNAYDEQQASDQAIKNFVGTCNRYLSDMEIRYDERQVAIGVFDRISDSPIALEYLSSGEKQIVSIFSQLYLEPGPDLAVLFDEPELSLSIEWQRMLLPDVLNSPRCKLLFAATHSPFVFDNELVMHTRDLASFTKLV